MISSNQVGIHGQPSAMRMEAVATHWKHNLMVSFDIDCRMALSQDKCCSSEKESFETNNFRVLSVNQGKLSKALQQDRSSVTQEFSVFLLAQITVALDDQNRLSLNGHGIIDSVHTSTSTAFLLSSPTAIIHQQSEYFHSS